MAAIAVGEDGSGALNFSELYAKIEEALPFYARPAFLRIEKELERTGEFKKIALNWVKCVHKFNFDCSNFQV